MTDHFIIAMADDMDLDRIRRIIATDSSRIEFGRVVSNFNKTVQ